MTSPWEDLDGVPEEDEGELIHEIKMRDGRERIIGEMKWITAPTWEGAELVLASAPIDDAASAIDVLSDPTNYTGALDRRVIYDE